jgi:uncharacterized circularly permuted ATP-grasp superfamily protein
MVVLDKNGTISVRNDRRPAQFLAVKIVARGKSTARHGIFGVARGLLPVGHPSLKAIMSRLPYDEMHAGDSTIRPHYAQFAAWLAGTPAARIAQKREEAERAFHRLGITFAVYGEDSGTERLIPFDLVPRIIPAAEWAWLERGLKQRVQALNTFLHDIYHEQKILASGLLPAERVLGNTQYRREMQGLNVPAGIYAHIAGVDLVRAGEGEWYVLEDNLRVPSGVSYMLENRRMMMRLLPELFASQSIRPVQHYPDMLLKTLHEVAPAGEDSPTVAVLTPGAYNSAYFEHAFVAQQMGVQLVEGQDLFVQNDSVFMRTTHGPERVHIIYRRVDDDFLDPTAFRSDSMIGVPGLFAAYRAGRVTLANAIGTGVADDKSIYPYVPEMIRYYLGEEPILNNVPTYQLARKTDRDYVLDHLAELVVKEVHGAGGYGMLVGPASTAEQRALFRERILAAPETYIAQPTLALSTVPVYGRAGLAPRHVDLRPFVLVSPTGIDITPGGLTRVALKKGSLVVNSSQGGGTKDTWVLEE